MYLGNGNNVVYDSQNTNLINLRENSFTIKKAEIPYALNDEIKKININTNNLKYNAIINKIKEIEPDFDITNYKITEHIYNEDDGNGMINFVYYINGEIETNKVFMATIENNVITEVALVGVLKDNYSKMKLTNESILINKVNQNKQNIERTKKLIMSTNENSVDSSYYLYDYNDGTLKNIIKFSKKLNPGNLSVNEVKEINIL